MVTLPARRPGYLGGAYGSDAHYAFALANRFYARPELKRADTRASKVLKRFCAGVSSAAG